MCVYIYTKEQAMRGAVPKHDVHIHTYMFTCIPASLSGYKKNELYIYIYMYVYIMFWKNKVFFVWSLL